MGADVLRRMGVVLAVVVALLSGGLAPSPGAAGAAGAAGAIGAIGAPPDVGRESPPTPDLSADGGGGFHPVTPVRLADSRRGMGLAAPLGPGEVGELGVLDVGGVPATGVRAVVLSVVAVAPSAPSHLTVWSAGRPRPATSTLNAVLGSPVANLATVAPGEGGAVAVRNASGTVHVVVDVLGWYGDDAAAGGGRYHPLPGTRLLDTRAGGGALPAGVPLDVVVTGLGGVPTTGVSAVVLNVVAVEPTALTHLTAWPTGEPRPATSTVNAAPGTTLANQVVLRPGAGGAVAVVNASGSTHVVVDLIGWYDEGLHEGGGFHPVDPHRIRDTRTEGRVLGPQESLPVRVLGVGEVPTEGVAAVVVNVTAVAAPRPGFLKVSPQGVDRPPVSTVNTPAGWTGANLQLVSPGVDGEVVVWANAGGVAVAVDVVGWFDAGVDLADAAVRASDRCDPLAVSLCLLPYPNDWYTAPDPFTDTGRRLDLDRRSTPANTDGIHIDPTAWNRNDGFSPGSPVLLHLPEVDLEASGAPPMVDPQASLDPTSPIVLLDATTGDRHPFWAELDAQADTDADRLLVLQPAEVLREGHRYVVALREGLVDGGGSPLGPTDAFRALRDRLISDAPHLETRRPGFEVVFGELTAAGVPRDDLLVAWDFTVASGRNLSERMLHLRDTTWELLGEAAPPFTVTEVEQDVNARIARRIHGTFLVPDFLTGDGGPGQSFDYGPDGLPRAVGVQVARFQCNVPHSVTGPGGGADPGPVIAGRPVVYGHGLLGSRSEVNAGNVGDMAEEHGMVFCATDWIGMAEEDILNAAAILGELSGFPSLADRVQQGILATLVMARLMGHDQGFVSHSAFRGPAGEPLLDTSEVFYDGNSQGGIIGGAATAVSTEWTRAVLGVTGMNYSVLLPRSVDFDAFLPIFRNAYPDQREHGLALALVQNLWDRAETNGYVQHLTADPYPGTPVHQVLLHVAFGDHQVANVSAEIEARAIGARIHQPALAPGRHHDLDPYWGIDPLPPGPWPGSAIVIWDSGTPTPPAVNLPPREGSDPHGDPRRTPAARAQKAVFLAPEGVVVDVCDALPCVAVGG